MNTSNHLHITICLSVCIRFLFTQSISFKLGLLTLATTLKILIPETSKFLFPRLYQSTRSSDCYYPWLLLCNFIIYSLMLRAVHESSISLASDERICEHPIGIPLEGSGILFPMPSESINCAPRWRLRGIGFTWYKTQTGFEFVIFSLLYCIVSEHLYGASLSIEPYRSTLINSLSTAVLLSWKIICRLKLMSDVCWYSPLDTR